MGIITKNHLPDMQASTTGFYKKKILKAGTRHIVAYIPVLMKDGSIQTVRADLSAYCAVDPDVKGVNMSRSLQSINEVLSRKHVNNDGLPDLQEFAKELSKENNSNEVHIKARFGLILDRHSPMSGAYSQKPVNIILSDSLVNGKEERLLSVTSTEMSLCPCSKEMSLLKNNISDEELSELKKLSSGLYAKIMMSGFGAHNQKSDIQCTVSIPPVITGDKNRLWIEDIVEMIEHSASSPTYSALKRPDEKHLTECSYVGGYFDDDHKFNKVEGTGPKFVEDEARCLAEKLDPLMGKTINGYTIVVENHESIHSDGITASAVLIGGPKDLRV